MSEQRPTLGTTLPARDFGPITRTDIVRYQGASGDFHPLHHDEPFARRAGYPTVISVGMLQAGLLATYVVDIWGADTIRAFRVRFRHPVVPGDLLTCSASVAGIEEGDAETRISLALEVRTQAGDLAVTGVATVAV